MEVTEMNINQLLSALDTYVWEPLQRRNHWLYQVDNKDWKTWILHGLLAVLFGHLFGLLWIGPLWGMVVACSLYALREFTARVKLGWFYKSTDGIMDTAGPVLFCAIEWMLRHR